MLHLLRKENQTVMIGDDIRVVVIEISKDEVFLGFDVPKNITVDREEVYLKKKLLKEDDSDKSKQIIARFKRSMKKWK